MIWHAKIILLGLLYAIVFYKNIIPFFSLYTYSVSVNDISDDSTDQTAIEGLQIYQVCGSISSEEK